MIRWHRLELALLAVVALASGCSDRKSNPSSIQAPQPTGVQSDSDSDAARPAIVFLGDSLTAGLGLRAADSYPALIQRRITQQGYVYRVVNAGLSGDTSAGGLRRLDWSLQGDVAVLVVALGGNDGLRGLPVAQLRDNLGAILTTAHERGIGVLLAGMEAPPNIGAEYTSAFRGVYAELARRPGVVSIPFLLTGVAGQPNLNQPDGIHPTAAGAVIVADTVWKALEPMLKKPASPP